ncbi:MAG: sporulation protein YabP [Halanaerobiaceae bacterium]
MTEKENRKNHLLSLSNRKDLEMEGVEEVVTFDENNILLQTTAGSLDITGNDLNIEKLNLDNSKLKVKGHIISLQYSSKKDTQGILQRLFK